MIHRSLSGPELIITYDTCPLSATVSSTNISCNNANGSITITNPTGSISETPNYEYSIDGFSSFNTTGNFTGLALGDYTVEIREGGDTCTLTTITISDIDNNDSDCDGIANAVDDDADNDGILDVDECGLATQALTDASVQAIHTDTGSTSSDLMSDWWGNGCFYLLLKNIMIII